MNDMNNMLKKLYRTTASFARQLIGNAARPKCAAALMAGREKHSGEPLRMVYIGAGRNREFLINRLFTESQIVRQQDGIHPLTGRWWGQRAENDADLVIVDLDLPYSLLYLGWDALRAPQWVKQKLILPSSKQAFIDSLSRNVRRKVFRCIRKYRYSYDLLNSDDEFKAFYHNFYAPFVRARFNKEGVVVDEAFFLSECRLGSLLQLKCDGRPIGGALLQPVGTQLSSVWGGFSATEVAAAASDVLDYFTIDYAYDRGFRVVDFGPSRPLLDDGVFRYKRKWGTAVYGSKLPTSDILIRPLNASAAMDSVMAHNFWIIRYRGKLAGQLMVDGQSMNTEMLQDIAGNFVSGIETIRLLSNSGFNADVRQAAENLPGICLIDFSDPREPALAAYFGTGASAARPRHTQVQNQSVHGST